MQNTKKNLKHGNNLGDGLIVDQKTMATNFTNYMNKVADMLVNDGPIYDVWIKFQIGLTEPLVFTTNSTDKQRNIIASLNMKKSCAGTANDFTLVIQYDPFNMGQNTADIVEQLDEYIAQAMSTDFEDSNKAMRGKIQYGYNSTSDTNLVSPNYEFYITGATSNIKFNSGLATYTFTGVSLLSADCDNTQSFPAHENWNMLDVILVTLYKYYGDPENPPKHVVNVTPIENKYHYLIDVPEELYKDRLEVEDGFHCEAASGMTPWQYCLKLFDEYPLTKSQVKSGKYDNILGELSYAERPKYLMYVEDIDGQHVIRIRHVTPALTIEDGKVISTELDEEDTLRIDYDITWGLQNKNNIIIEWSPQVDLKLYLIRNAMYKADMIDLLTTKGYRIDSDTLKAINENKYLGVAQAVQPPFDAQLTILGIPADPPLGAQLVIKPRILETVSRTAGVYMITGCEDNISTNGLYTTTLDVYRIKSTINDLINAQEDKRLNEAIQTMETIEPEVSILNEETNHTYIRTKAVDTSKEYVPNQAALVLINGNIYKTPSVTTIIDTLDNGTKVSILAYSGNYCYVGYSKNSENKAGYIEANSLGII